MGKVDYREILLLKSQGYGKRWIAARVHSSHHTVTAVLDAAATKDVCWPLENDISNDKLEGILFPQKRQASARYAEPNYATIHKELAKPGVTMTLLWEEYRTKCYENGQTPYQSTQFGEKYRRWARVTKATMRIQHKPGDAMVDFQYIKKKYGVKQSGCIAAQRLAFSGHQTRRNIYHCCNKRMVSRFP